MEQSEPFIVVTSKPGTETNQIFVCCERRTYLESKLMTDALLDMMSMYFVFNIAYPKSLHGILIFLHHVFNLQDQQTVTSVDKTLVGNLIAHIQWLLENEWLLGNSWNETLTIILLTLFVQYGACMPILNVFSLICLCSYLTC